MELIKLCGSVFQTMESLEKCRVIIADKIMITVLQKLTLQHVISQCGFSIVPIAEVQESHIAISCNLPIVAIEQNGLKGCRFSYFSLISDSLRCLRTLFPI